MRHTSKPKRFKIIQRNINLCIHTTTAMPVLKRFLWNPSADQNVEDNVVFLTNVFNAENFFSLSCKQVPLGEKPQNKINNFQKIKRGYLIHIYFISSAFKGHYDLPLGGYLKLRVQSF